MDKQKALYRAIHLRGAIDMTTKLIEQLQRQKERLDETYGDARQNTKRLLRSRKFHGSFQRVLTCGGEAPQEMITI